jgi:hypothetical protein
MHLEGLTRRQDGKTAKGFNGGGFYELLPGAIALR